MIARLNLGSIYSTSSRVRLEMNFIRKRAGRYSWLELLGESIVACDSSSSLFYYLMISKLSLVEWTAVRVSREVEFTDDDRSPSVTLVSSEVRDCLLIL